LSAAFCGDGVRSPTEPCEGSDLGGQTCSSLGFYGGTGLKCAADCTFDTSGCAGICGDGVVNGPHEECDGAPPAGKTCADFEAGSGFLDCTELCSISYEGCSQLGLQTLGPTGVDAIWGSSSQDVYAAGPGLQHWDGATWSPVTLPSTPASVAGASWGSIWGSGPNDVLAVAKAYSGDVGTPVLYWDGVTWSLISIDPKALPSLIGVWGTGPNDEYVFGGAVEASPVIYRWDGSRWSRMPWGADQPIDYVAMMGGSGPNDLYACLNGGTCWHWKGAGWQKVAIADEPIQSIWAAAADDVYAGGERAIYHWDGTSWAPVPDVPGGRVWGGGRDDVFVVITTQGSGVLHWNGAIWSPVLSMGAVSDLWEDGAGSTFLVGQDGIERISRGVWTDTCDLAGALWGTNDDLFSLWSAGNSVSFSRINRAGNAFEPLTSPPLIAADALWGTAVDDIWVTGSDQSNAYGVWRWNGVDWAKSTAPGTYLRMAPSISAIALGGSSSSDVWAIGELGTHWDGRAWSHSADFNAIMRAVWARNSIDVFAVGQGGAINHWDGTQWKPMPSPVTADLYDVWGAGQDVYAVGAGGTILHYAGKQWVSMVSFTKANVDHVRASGAGNVFATDGAGLLHLRGGAWERLPGPPSANSLWVTPNAVFIAEDSPSNLSLVHRFDLVGISCQAPERNCTDGWDNDCDGLQDAEDPDCANVKFVEQCANLADDDGDGLADCADPDCAGFPTCRKK
jgi:hypothetical protein